MVWQIMLICWPQTIPNPLFPSCFPARDDHVTQFWLKKEAYIEPQKKYEEMMSRETSKHWLNNSKS